MDIINDIEKTRKTTKEVIQEKAQSPILQQLGYNFIKILDTMPCESSSLPVSNYFFFCEIEVLISLEKDLMKMEGLKHSLRLDKKLMAEHHGGITYLFVQKEFNTFVRIVEEEISKERYLKEIAWEVLKTAAMTVLAEEFETSYGHYFEDVESKSLEEMIHIYCNIEEIRNPRHVINQGKFLYFLVKYRFFDLTQLFKLYKDVDKLIKDGINDREYNNFKNKVKNLHTSHQLSYTIHDVDLMTGLEFEQFITALFRKMGYLATTTKASMDQGIDVIAEKMGRKIGIQAKCYSKKVGNSAVQEVVAGLCHYHCSKGIVITNNYFTDSAIALATSNNVLLWDRDKLIEKINELF